MATHFSIFTWRIPWRGAWRATVQRVCKELDTTEWLTLLLSFSFKGMANYFSFWLNSVLVSIFKINKSPDCFKTSCVLSSIPGAGDEQVTWNLCTQVSYPILLIVREIMGFGFGFNSCLQSRCQDWWQKFCAKCPESTHLLGSFKDKCAVAPHTDTLKQHFENLAKHWWHQQSCWGDLPRGDGWLSLHACARSHFPWQLFKCHVYWFKVKVSCL